MYFVEVAGLLDDLPSTAANADQRSPVWCSNSPQERLALKLKCANDIHSFREAAFSAESVFAATSESLLRLRSWVLMKLSLLSLLLCAAVAAMNVPQA